MPELSRRELLAAGAAAAFLPRPAHAAPATVPVAIASGNGLRAVDKACDLVAAGTRPVEAAVMGVTIVENDPNDMSVGYGGLPNEEGVVQLDSCVMDGTLGTGGSVAAIENIKNPSQVALRVMDRTDHVILVGRGAYRFARAHGFPHEDLLTERARKKWLEWKENLSDKDDWVAPERKKGGTINCLARAPDGRLGGCTTTSGLAYKLPGRVGDSPIIGAGLYVDDSAGAAGCTGRGEACILSCASFLAVESMRKGMTAGDAALEAVKRIAQRTKLPRLLKDGKPNFDVAVYALRADGTHGCARIWGNGPYAVRDGSGTRKVPARSLYAR